MSEIQNKDLVSAIGNRNGLVPKIIEKLSRIAIWNSAVSMVLIMALAAMYIFQPSPQSFAVSPRGVVTKLVPLTEPVGQAGIVNFANQCIIDSYSLDFQNWEKQLGELGSCYTESGYNTYMQAVTPLKERVVEGRYITAAGLSAPAVIVKSGVIDGVLKYRLRAGVVIGFEGQTKRIATQNWQVDVILDRVPVSKNPIGYAISSIVAKQAGSIN